MVRPSESLQNALELVYERRFHSLSEYFLLLLKCATLVCDHWNYVNPVLVMYGILCMLGRVLFM
jgi:hypothetical protein